MKLNQLQVLEVEASHWDPQPSHAAAQRVLASELRIFCPSLRLVVFWIGHRHTPWAYVGDEWTREESKSTSAQEDTLWRLV